VRAIIWVGSGLLALIVLPIAALVLYGLVRRVQIARTGRELRRMGFVGDQPHAPEWRPVWPLVAAGLTGLVLVGIMTSVLPARPSTLTRASEAGSSAPRPTINPTVVSPSTNPGSEHPATHPTASPTTPRPQATATPPASPTAHAQGDVAASSAVTALPRSARAIQLDWARVSGADGYAIERSTDTVHWKSVASTSSGQTRYTDPKLSSGTTYYYRVISLVNDQETSRSDVVSATTAVDASIAPVLAPATVSATSIELTWGDVNGALSYGIERSPDGANWTPIGTTGQDVTSFTDAGLASATTYYYRVVAVTSAGESPPSTALPATTDPAGPSASDANVTPSDVSKAVS